MARTDDALQEAKDNLETLITNIEDGDFSLVMYNTAIAQAAALISIAESLAKLVELQEAEKEKERQFWSKKAALDLDNPVGIVPQEIAQRIVDKFAKDGE